MKRVGFLSFNLTFFAFVILATGILSRNLAAQKEGASSIENSAANTNVDSITFCRPNNMVSALSYIAEQQGFFKEQNLDVKFETATNAKVCQDLVVAGKIDFFNGGEGPFIYLSTSPHSLVIVAFVQKNPEVAVYARRNKGINSFQDLKGKRVGYLPGTVSYFYLVRLLQKLNLKMEDLALISMQPPTMTQALTSGSIDAFVMWEPWGSNALKELGSNGIQLTDPSIYRYHALLATTQQIKNDRPHVIKKVLQAELKAEEFIALHPKESIAILAQAISCDKALLEKNWMNFENRVNLNNQSLQLMQEDFNWLQRQDKSFAGLPMPNFRASIDPSFLQEIAPDRVASDF